MLKMKIEEIAKETGIDIDAESIDSNAATGKQADLFVTVKEFADIFPEEQPVAIVRSYMNKKKIKEDILDTLLKMSQEKKSEG